MAVGGLEACTHRQSDQVVQAQICRRPVLQMVLLGISDNVLLPG